MNVKKSLLILLALALAALLVQGCAHPAEITTPTETEAASGSDEAQQEAFDYSAGLTADGFFEGVKASDYVSLPEYKGITVPAEVLTADADEVNEQIKLIESYYTSYEEIKNRPVADGDTLNIDYVGKVDGVEFAGGNTKGNGTVVTIGVTNYIDDFLEQLIGHKPGETFDIEVTFPEPYSPNEDLAGKDAVFTVTINYIQGEEQTRELDDEIAAEYGFASVKELTEDIERWLISTQKSEFIENLLGGAELKGDIPQSVMDYVINTNLAEFQYYAGMYSMTLDEIIAAYTEYDGKDAYIEGFHDDFVKNATLYLAVQAIAEAEGLSVDQATVESSDYASYVESYGAPYVKLVLLQEEVVAAFIFDNAK